MSLQHTPLEPERLSPDVKRALGGGPAKMMAARGLAPMSNPGDLITLLYQLVVDNDANIRTTADKSAGELPPTILAAALADINLDPRVLDYFTEKSLAVPDLIQTIILNQATADETISTIAKRGGQREVDLVSTNQERLLRHPQIIASMYMNKKSRQSVVDRAVELAVHNRIRVPGIPAWDEICKTILTSGKGPEASYESDAAFAEMLAAGDGMLRELTDREERADDEKNKRWSERSVVERIRLAMIGTAFHRSFAIRDANKLIAVAAIKAPGVKDSEAQKFATNTSLAQDVIAYIADKKEWTKLYSVKLALCQNPKTPIGSTARLVPHLREKDLRNLARSKGVPSAVNSQAKKLLIQRSSGGRSRR